jgi:hypothetical protein
MTMGVAIADFALLSSPPSSNTSAQTITAKTPERNRSARQSGTTAEDDRSGQHLILRLHCRKLTRDRLVLNLHIRIMIMMCTLRLVFDLPDRADRTVKLTDHALANHTHMAVGEQWRASDWEGKEVRKRMTVQEGEFGLKIRLSTIKVMNESEARRCDLVGEMRDFLEPTGNSGRILAGSIVDYVSE